MQDKHLPLFYIGRRGGVVLLRWTPVGEVWARDLAGLLYYIHGRNILLSRPLSLSLHSGVQLNTGLKTG